LGKAARSVPSRFGILPPPSAACDMSARATRANPSLVSVVLPVLNGEAHLGEQLAALAIQTYEQPWEVLLVDNGCTDRTLEVVRRWAPRLPALRVVDARERRGLNHARNAGAAAASGELLAFCDSDDVVDPGWLAALAAAAVGADIVAGVLDSELLNRGLPRPRGTPPPQTFPIRHRFLPGLPGGNCGVWTSVARELGWNEEFRYGSSDLEFAWRARLAGYRIAAASDALVHVRRRAGLRSVAVQWFRYGLSAPLLYREFRSAGMPRTSVTAGARTWAWLAKEGARALRSRPFRRDWVKVAARSAGSVAGSVRYGVLFLESPELLGPGSWP
jgi:glycosyltransferase involved in cell wall biosynthesis